MNDDKYPVESDRRRFVKGVVGGASLAGVGASAAAAVNSLTAPSGKGGGTVTYFAVENTAGPAPRGMPQVPVEVDDEGFLRGLWPTDFDGGGVNEGVAEATVAGETYSSSWFQYCGVQTYPGVAPEADQDNYLRYANASPFAWQDELGKGGQRVNVEDFADYREWGNQYGTPGTGKPAAVTWRSQDVEASATMPVEVIRSRIVEEKAAENDWLAATTDSGFMAHLNKCTHFCCVPGYKTSNYQGNGDSIYCQCHQSIYDPYSIVKKSFVALPRPEQ